MFLWRSCCWAVLLCSCTLLQAAEKRPNILFIAVDDLRPELQCYGAQHIHSPHIDRLASQGMLFTRAYCMVAVCGASRASLMTGIRPTPRRFVTYYARADEDAPGVVTLNTHLKRHGYYTVSLGKIFHVLRDSQAGWSERPWRPSNAGSSRWYHRPENRKLHQQRQRQGRRLRGPAYEAAPVDDLACADGQLAARAIETLKRLRQGDKPFFLAVGFFKPHLPFVAPKKYWDLYDPAQIDLPPNSTPPRGAPAASLHTFGELRAYAGIPPRGPVPRETARRLIHGYYACVSFIDAQVGKILRAVDELGLQENTIVVLWSDHGWNLGEHGLWCKHCCYETAMRIPLLIRAPGFPQGLRCNRLVESIDLYPTLCDLAGVPKPSHLEGRSLVPLLKDPQASWKQAAVGRYGRGDTIRTPRYRYTEYTSRSGKPLGRMLYDHRNDPRETVNIADEPELAEQVEQLARQLHAIKGKD